MDSSLSLLISCLAKQWLIQDPNPRTIAQRYGHGRLFNTFNIAFDLSYLFVLQYHTKLMVVAFFQAVAVKTRDRLGRTSFSFLVNRKYGKISVISYEHVTLESHLLLYNRIILIYYIIIILISSSCEFKYIFTIKPFHIYFSC